jgi:hypothetical protein
MDRRGFFGSAAAFIAGLCGYRPVAATVLAAPVIPTFEERVKFHCLTATWKLPSDVSIGGGWVYLVGED